MTDSKKPEEPTPAGGKPADEPAAAKPADEPVAAKPADEPAADAPPAPADDAPASPSEAGSFPAAGERRVRERRQSDRRQEPASDVDLDEPRDATRGGVNQAPAGSEREPGPNNGPALPGQRGQEGPLSIDGWPLESLETGAPIDLPSAVTPTPAEPLPAASQPQIPQQQMPSATAAAYEAARIVGEMGVDIESAPGAALVAAAAAGAAIEVARARAASGGDPDRSLTSMPSLPELAELAADAAAKRDPAATVRLQRERILRALAEDIGANVTGETHAISAATGEHAHAHTPSHGTPVARAEGRAPSQPGRPSTGRPDDPAAADEIADDELDPVAIAAAAIARIRDRARSEVAELRVHYRRHDILVLVAALVVIIAIGRIHTLLVTPPTEPFDASAEHGLWFEHEKGWLKSPAGPLPSPRLAREIAPAQPKLPDTLYRVELTSTVDPTARIEVTIDKKPAWSNIVTGLDLDRRTRWGELYTLDDSSVHSIEDHQWLRTVYRFAHAQHKGDTPRIDRAVEYATIDREQIYVLTFFGTPQAIERIEDIVAPTLRVATQTALPLVPQTGHLSTRKYPNAVARAFDGAVMVVVADVVDGRLRARGGGSGVVVGRDGSVITNFHVIHDRNGRLHDVFVIGRFSEQDKAPQLYCAGKPSRSKLQRELDLALLKCDLDLDGRSWNPSDGAAWVTLPQARSADIKVGQRIWILGYPDVGGGGLTLSEGEVEGWSGIDGAAGRDFIKTDAAIRHGNSGGPVVDDAGHLVGIASAVRTKQTAGGDIVEIVQAGGRIRPVSAATDLLAIAAAGWTPREGHTDVDLQPSAIEAPAEGVQIQSRVLDAVGEAPVRDALVMVLRPGVRASDVDVNRLDDQVLAYGRSNTQGEFTLKQPVPVPGAYTIMVVARGYEPVIGERELTLDGNTPAIFDPWGKILLRAR